MGQVPLLTREQEVEISKRIEEAETMVQTHINRFGFIAQAHLDLAPKLTEGGERFDRVILDKKIESRERYMKLLPRLCKQVREAERETRRSNTQTSVEHGGNGSEEARKLSRRRSRRCRSFYPKFYFKQKVTEEFVHLADEHYARLLTQLQDEMSKTVRASSGASARTLAERSREIRDSALAFAR